MRANGQLGADLSALLGGVRVVDACLAGPMPAYGRQMGRAAITGHHAVGSACGRSATEGPARWPSEPKSEPDDVILRSSFFKFVKQ